MDPYTRTLYELKTISSIQKNAKITTNKEFIVIDNSSIIQGLYRWWNGESRDKAQLKISQTIKLAICLSNLMIAIPNKEKMNDVIKIKARLSFAKQGIENLCETYKQDSDFIGKIKPLISDIIVHLGVIEAYLNS